VDGAADLFIHHRSWGEHRDGTFVISLGLECHWPLLPSPPITPAISPASKQNTGPLRKQQHTGHTALGSTRARSPYCVFEPFKMPRLDSEIIFDLKDRDHANNDVVWTQNTSDSITLWRRAAEKFHPMQACQEFAHLLVLGCSIHRYSGVEKVERPSSSHQMKMSARKLAEELSFSHKYLGAGSIGVRIADSPGHVIRLILSNRHKTGQHQHHHCPTCRPRGCPAGSIISASLI
jgi:hypothetical protein